MKASFAAVVVATLAGSALAAPVESQKQANDPLPNGSIIDNVGCFVSGFFGGSKCYHHDGETGETTTTGPDAGDESAPSDNAAPSDNNSYTYTYDSKPDGTYTVVITPDNGKPCTETVDGKGKKVNDVVEEAADMCFS